MRKFLNYIKGKEMQRLKTVLTLWMLGLLLTGCSGTPAEGQPATEAGANTTGKITVVSTYSILGDWVQAVGGDKVTVRTLVGPGGDAHTFEPTPTDGVALAEADIVFENGFGFEPWLDDLYTASGSDAPRVVVTDGIDPLSASDEAHSDEEHDEDEAESAEDDHAEEEDHGEVDPHVWHDVGLAIQMVEAVRDGLSETDPANRATYQANADAYLGQLRELDQFVLGEVDKLPVEQRKLVTTHDTFGYFAKRYGFEIVGTAIASVSTEAGDPSAAAIAELVEEIKATGVKTIFAENISNNDLMSQIAQEAGVTLAPTLFTDALGESGSEGDSYLKMVRYNVTTMVEALDP